ncbi:tyrosine-type recombinase/integrase [Nocardia araoensis]|uniref:tyrosine-type recombinase/integrase n=1 Tax=Nocardia araoensis TaxID=228600 RepID=UPI0002DB700E|nr:site-specific integrase [Nocardia araoensis]
MTPTRRLAPVPTIPAGMPTAAALAQYLRWLAGHRGRSGHITSPETVRAYTGALPMAFAGIATLAELDRPGRDRLHRNIRTAWVHRAPATFNTKRAAVASALNYFQAQQWIGDAAAVLDGLGREYQPKPDANRVRSREAIDRLIADKRWPLADRTLRAMLYATAGRAEEVLRLDVTDLDRSNRRARTRRKGGKPDELLYDIRTARLLGQLLTARTSGPVFLSRRTAPDDGTVLDHDIDPVTGRRRMSYRTAERHLGAATDGWDLHDLRHSRLTHAGEDGATDTDLMNLSGHEDRRTLQRYLKPSKDGTHRRLDDIDARRVTWTPGADELAARLSAAERPAPAAVARRE